MYTHSTFKVEEKYKFTDRSIGYIISNIHQFGCLNKFIAYFNIYNNDFATRPEEKKAIKIIVINSTTFCCLKIWLKLIERKRIEIEFLHTLSCHVFFSNKGQKEPKEGKWGQK